MIVKSLSRHGGGTSQLLSYILRYVTAEKEAKERKEKGPKEHPFIIRHNMRARSLKGYAKELEKLESLRMYKHANQLSVHHHILSFSSKDKAQITDELLKDLAHQFIVLRGENNIYVGTKHADKEHIHLHLAMSAVDLAGRSARISKARFQEIKTELDKYQKEHYPKLSHSLPDHGKKARNTVREAIVENAKNARGADKATLLSSLEKIYADSQSEAHFLSQLAGQGYAPYYRSGALTGVMTEEGRKFRLNRLGYTPEKLATLNQAKEQEEKALSELRALRGQSTKERTAARLEALEEGDAEPTSEIRQLEQLQSLRESSSERDTLDRHTEERDIEIDEEAQEQENERGEPDDRGR